MDLFTLLSVYVCLATPTLLQWGSPSFWMYLLPYLPAILMTMLLLHIFLRWQWMKMVDDEEEVKVGDEERLQLPLSLLLLLLLADDADVYDISHIDWMYPQPITGGGGGRSSAMILTMKMVVYTSSCVWIDLVCIRTLLFRNTCTPDDRWLWFDLKTRQGRQAPLTWR